MCHKLTLNQTMELFNFKNSDELHEFKEMVGGYIPELLKPHKLGGNPDLAWCGDATAKKLCLKSRYNVGKEECLDFFISDLINYE